jgi:hypothetical protein
MDFFYGYNENKLKPYLKMAVQRIQIASNKKSISVKHQKREIAQLLADHKDEKARIKVEHIIREDFIIEAYEMLELLLELVHERIKQISSNETVPVDLKEAVCSLIWAATNVDISEFGEIKKQFTKKYGTEFTKAAENNEANCVNPRLFQKLVYKPPSTKLVMGYLVEIAKGYQVEWDPVESGLPEGGMMSDLPLASPQGFSVPMAPASNITAPYSNSRSPPLQLTPEELKEQEVFRKNQLANKNNNNSNVVYATPMPAPMEHHVSPRDNLSALGYNNNNNNKNSGNNDNNNNNDNDFDSGDYNQGQYIPTANVVSVAPNAAPSAPPVTTTSPSSSDAPSPAPILSLEARLAALHKKN